MSLFDRYKAWWRGWRGRAKPLPPAVDPAVAGEAARVAAGVPRQGAGDAAGVPEAAAPSPPRRAGRARGPRPIRLALQGGGSHGAFTWGVLEGLLRRDDLAIEAISGASAGALNAAVLATGWAQGGRDGALGALQRFWQDIGSAGAARLPLLPALPSGAMFDLSAMPGYEWASRFLRTLSPYDYNPLNLNPLRDVLVRHVDPLAVREGPIRVFATATAVRSGEPRVFSGAALGIDALLASACLPFLFQAVEIDGEPYWDGGYSGNPSLHPLLDAGGDCDIVVVRINPSNRDGVPRRSLEIMDRISEITFNASLIGELRMIDHLNRLQRRIAGEGNVAAQCRVHVVADDVDLATLPASSRLHVDPAFVARLRALGQAAVAAFLQGQGDAIGRPGSAAADAARAVEGEALPAVS
ncbi:patatin-like phospholipase family protein [Luteimonas kalidii]|uniref:Patatin-like phospholipase family protein n=1 Tax=Luteimonas kalidii TaxID=3042025 RepID=A0ABT6JPF7_9GAMM|nr:patatin-like phospholipase family protein [Luteimonas kalidii]MDH5832570.1 patatin-like phospholipase family protein [Luteimonas kalidii]